MERATGDVGNKEENMNGKQPERESLVPKFQWVEVVCLKCRRGAFTQIMNRGEKFLDIPFSNLPFYL